ncbi:MAG: SWIM zinc finger family protein [Bacteroidota bacterium]
MLPPISAELVRLNTTDKVFQRAKDYAEGRVVRDPILRGNMLTAQVDGSDWQPYRVLITFDAHTVTEASCTCPYDWGGWCKHIGAVLLTVLARPGETHISEPIDTLLDDLSGRQLRQLLRDVIAQHPDVLETLDVLLQPPSAR